MSKKNSILFLTVALTLILASCNRKTIYSHYEHTPLAGWEKNDTLKFTVPAITQSGTYEEEIALRVTTDYLFKELYLLVEQSLQNAGTARRNTLLCPLVSDEGAYEGKGTYYIQYVFPLGRIQLEQGELLHIDIRHNMKREILQGITDVGVRLKRTSD